MTYTCADLPFTAAYHHDLNDMISPGQPALVSGYAGGGKHRKTKRSKVKRSKVKRSKVKRSKVKRSKVKRSKVKRSKKVKRSSKRRR